MRREGNFEPRHRLSAAKSAMPPFWATQDPSRVCAAEMAEMERLEGGEEVLPVAAPVAAQAVQGRAAGRGRSRGRAAARGGARARGTARGMAVPAAAAQSPPAPRGGRVPTGTADDVTAAQGLHQMRQGGTGAGVAGDASPGSPVPLQAGDESRSPPDATGSDVAPSPVQPVRTRGPARADNQDKEAWARAPRNELVPQPPTYPEDKQEDIQQKVHQMLKVYKQNPKKSYESQWNSYSIWHE